MYILSWMKTSRKHLDKYSNTINICQTQFLCSILSTSRCILFFLVAEPLSATDLSCGHRDGSKVRVAYQVGSKDLHALNILTPFLSEIPHKLIFFISHREFQVHIVRQLHLKHTRNVNLSHVISSRLHLRYLCFSTKVILFLKILCNSSHLNSISSHFSGS